VAAIDSLVDGSSGPAVFDGLGAAGAGLRTRFLPGEVRAAGALRCCSVGFGR